eukprot:8142701-Alexandrium_andersonii.AAC.1
MLRRLPRQPVEHRAEHIRAHIAARLTQQPVLRVTGTVSKRLANRLTHFPTVALPSLKGTTLRDVSQASGTSTRTH